MKGRLCLPTPSRNFREKKATRYSTEHPASEYGAESRQSTDIAYAGLVVVFALVVLTATTEVTEPATMQRIAVPTYFEPGATWTRVDNSYPTLGRVVINPLNGPGKTKSGAYTRQVKKSQTSRITVLGYVYTGYGKRSTVTLAAEIDKYYSWYGVDGIFFDEVSTNRTKATAYYKDLYLYVKNKPGKRIVVLNPGTQTRECYMRISDTLVTFEGSYDDYVRNYPSPGWVSKYPAERFWHLLYGVSKIKNMERAVCLSRTRRAGWLYITPNRLPNPWNTLPSDTYWGRELQTVRSD